MKTIHLAVTLTDFSFHLTVTTSSILIFPRHFPRNANAGSLELPPGACPSSAALEVVKEEKQPAHQCQVEMLLYTQIIISHQERMYYFHPVILTICNILRRLSGWAVHKFGADVPFHLFQPCHSQMTLGCFFNHHWKVSNKITTQTLQMCKKHYPSSWKFIHTDVAPEMIGNKVFPLLWEEFCEYFAASQKP